ncbi:MAG: ribosome-associated translation inhibitor RaiA [Phycisphaerae bacterium]
MQVTIIGRHMDVPQDLKRYIEEKAQKLPHYYDRVMAVEVLVEGEHSAKRVELVVTVAGHENFVAQEKGDDIFACFDICIGHIEKQLTRFKDRIRDKKHRVRTGQEETEA